MLYDNKFELGVLKFIDYIYLNNYIRNSLIKKNNLDNEWKIFSTHYSNDNINILYFIKTIKTQPNYSYELLLLTIHIYIKICSQYAHLIEDYTYLFASIYVAINKTILDNNLSCNFLAKFLNVSENLAQKMVILIEKFMIHNDIYFDSTEKEYIINNIVNN